MKSNWWVIVLLLNSWFAVILSAQEIEVEETRTEVVVKVYANFLYFNSQYNPRPYDFNTEPFSFWGITPAVSFRNNESLIIQEFEPRFWFSKSDHRNITAYEVGLRYELCWYLNKEFIQGMKFRWGASSRIYYYHANIGYSISGFPTRTQNGGLEFSMTAHLEYRISEKIKFELTTSNLNINFAVDYQYTENPALTRRQKTQGGFDFEAFDQRILRIGIGYEF